MFSFGSLVQLFYLIISLQLGLFSVFAPIVALFASVMLTHFLVTAFVACCVHFWQLPNPFLAKYAFSCVFVLFAVVAVVGVALACCLHIFSSFFSYGLRFQRIQQFRFDLFSCNLIFLTPFFKSDSRHFSVFGFHFGWK